LQELQGLPKTYTGTLRLGATTPSYDAETEPDQQFPTDHITADLLSAAAAELTGAIEQIPPMFSAIKVDGQPLYKRARKGESIEIEARPVTINRFDLTRMALPEVDFLVDCSKGTYIRSLAYDLGKKVNSGAYLTALCRTKVGAYRLEDAWQVEDLFAHITNIQSNHP
ncbi:MAG: tRNA pseudouridine(55) synthase, partial [Bacteroidota bacterium]